MTDSGKGQIMIYFIEEAKEHLETIEQGLLNLKTVVTDQEKTNELFRAAHSVKGGAAMLGFTSISKTAHRLEDCFKILKEEPINVDQKLEGLFLNSFDTLRDLLERLQGPFGLREEEGEQILKEAEPVFIDLQTYLTALAASGSQADANAAFPEKVLEILRQILQLFKEQESSTNRQQLQELCKKLEQLNDDSNWKKLIQTASGAIANSKNSYRTLAPFVIKEIKQASDIIVAGKAAEVVASRSLQLLKEKGSTVPKYISSVAETKAVAEALIANFDKKQLSEIVHLLQKASK